MISRVANISLEIPSLGFTRCSQSAHLFQKSGGHEKCSVANNCSMILHGCLTVFFLSLLPLFYLWIFPPYFSYPLPMYCSLSFLLFLPPSSFLTIYFSPVSTTFPSLSKTNGRRFRWSSWSRSTERSAGRWSPSTWRVASASSAASAGTTTWTRRWRRRRGPRKRTGSSTRRMRNWETAGRKLQSCSRAGEEKHADKRKCENTQSWMNQWAKSGRVNMGAKHAEENKGEIHYSTAERPTYVCYQWRPGLTTQ